MSARVEVLQEPLWMISVCGSVLQLISRASQPTTMEGEELEGEEPEVEASLQDTLLSWVEQEEEPNTVRRTFTESGSKSEIFRFCF